MLSYPPDYQSYVQELNQEINTDDPAIHDLRALSDRLDYLTDYLMFNPQLAPMWQTACQTNHVIDPDAIDHAIFDTDKYNHAWSNPTYQHQGLRWFNNQTYRPVDLTRYTNLIQDFTTLLGQINHFHD